MRGPGDIALVSSYELGHQPIALASPVALLRQHGFRPVAVDAAIAAPTDATIAQAKLVGLSTPMHTALRLAVPLARRVRAINPAAHICFYGLYATLNADYLVAEGLADTTLSGEFEAELVSLAERLAGAGQGGQRQSVQTPPIVRKIPFATPARDGLPPLSQYARLLHLGREAPAGYVEATRGCRHTCRHCPVTPIYRGRFFVVPADVVLADIRQQVANGAEHITFGDPDFLNGPGHVLKIARAMRAEFPRLTFDATTKIEHILEFRHLLPEFASLGCLFFVSAVESVADEVLRRIAKGHTRADVETALDLADAVGITLRPSLLPFTPWTSLDDYVELLEFIERRDLIDRVDPVHLSIRLLVPPGSALLDEPDASDFFGPLDAAEFAHTWTHRDPRVDQLQREVAGIVEAAELAATDTYVTFDRIKAVAWAAVGRSAPGPTPRPPIDRPAPPRLTESWFC